MKSILTIVGLILLLSLCNLSEKLKPAANSNTGQNTGTEKQPPAMDREAVISELMRLENEITTAGFNGDISVLARNMADNYVGTLADGSTQTKNQVLASTRPDKTTKSWAITDPQLVSLSEDSATLSYIQTQHTRNGQTFRARVTDTFVKQNGRWLVSAEQQTIMR